jgi:hypothetical protein
MIWALGALWAMSFVLLLRPFVAQKTSLETSDALDVFFVRQVLLLCLLFIALFSVPFGEKLLQFQIHLNLKQLLIN